MLLHQHHKLPPVYESLPGNTSGAQQKTMEEHFLQLLAEMENTFNNDGDEMSDLFWSKMYAFAYSIIDVWEAGACPRF